MNKNSIDIAGAVTTMPVFFILDLNKSNDDKFLYLNGSILQIWTALKPNQCRLFLLLGFAKRVTLQFWMLYLKTLFSKNSLIMGAEIP